MDDRCEHCGSPKPTTEPTPTEVTLDVDGMGAGEGIVCMGKATQYSDGTWRCLANVHGALGIIQIRMTPCPAGES